MMSSSENRIMSNRNALLSFVADRAIGTKIAVGFALVLFILAVSSIIAYIAFGRVAGAIAEDARLVANSAMYRDIDLQVTRYRGHVREYVFSDDEDIAASAIKEGDTLRQLIADGLPRVNNPERHQLLVDAAKQADLYAGGFERVHAMNREQLKLETEVLDVVGQKMTDGFSAMLAGAVKAGNAEMQRLGAEGAG